MPNSTSPTGDHSDLLTEAQLQKLCGIMYDFARQVGYGLRTYNREVGSSPSSGNAINIHQLAVLLKSMPEGMDHPLAYAMNSFQAFTVCLQLDPQLYLMERVWDRSAVLSVDEQDHSGVRHEYSRLSPVPLGKQCASLNEKTVCNFLLSSSNTRGISWLWSRATPMNVSGRSLQCRIGKRNSQLWTRRILCLTVMDYFLPNFKGIQIGYTTQVGLRRLGRATWNLKVFDPLIME